MFLKELEIIGFKSFGLKSKFNFSEGITALVGPNGCGKSNIVDALRWVLGEQKTNVLRSDSMDNVIFNGTKDRKPSGLAEVVLTIENNKQILPSEYNDVSVARRLYRNGDSKYLLNKANCRLKDINNLFMDTGMGPDSYSVIELKMVESLLSGRNEDRKNLLEEAAGITKYKVRRKESERKLKSVEADLERVEDIVSEIRKNVGSLSRQAAKTRKFNKLTEELKELEIIFYALSLGWFKESSSETYSKINKLKTQLKELKTISESHEKDLEKLNEAKNFLQSELSESRVELSKLSAKKSDLKQKIAVNEVKQKNLQREIKRFEEDKVGNEQSIKNKNNRLLELAEEKKKYSAEQNVLLRDLDLKNEKINELNAKINSLNSNKSTIEKSINDANRRIDQLNFKNKQRQENLEKLKSQIENYSKLIADSKNLIEQSKSNQVIKQNELDEIINKLDELNLLLNQEKEKSEKLRSEFNSTNQEIREKEAELRQKNNELRFWEGTIDKESNAGFLQSNKDWNNNFATLAENLAIEDKYLAAFNSILGKFSNGLVIEELDSAFAAADILKNKNKGKQEFIFGNIQNVKNQISLPEGVIDFVHNIPKTSDKISNYLKNKFNNWVLVDKIDNYLSLIENSEVNGIVDLEGSYISANGEIYVGGKETVSGNFGKLEKIKSIKIEIESLDTSIKQIQQKRDNIKSELDKIDIQSLNQKIILLDKDKNRINKELADLNIRVNTSENKLEIYSNNLSNLEKEKENYIESDEELTEIADLTKHIESDKKELENLSLEIHKFKVNQENQIKERSNIQISEVNVKNKLANIKSEEDNLINGVQFAERRIAKAEKDFENNKTELDISLHESETAIELLESVQNNFDEISGKSELLESKSKEKDLEIQNVNRELKITNLDLEKFTSEEHKLEIEFAELNTKAENIIKNAIEKYEISAEELLALNPDGDTDELRPKVDQLKEKLSSIGNVNFMALEEYEKENERLIFYETQIEDLTKSKDTLMQTIKEINTTAETQLLDTFNKVRANFKDLFHTLFNEEGECDITLEGDNPLEADLKIMAKPPGKKPHSIDMLSGGEKTLTAIALLFAIYLVKPSPFCILDEVDAPLDDNNIGRFVNLIKRFSNNTQFIIVTHNKKTMEAADNLYGITQQEQGLSRIVSVELGKQTEIPQEN